MEVTTVIFYLQQNTLIKVTLLYTDTCMYVFITSHKFFEITSRKIKKQKYCCSCVLQSWMACIIVNGEKGAAGLLPCLLAPRWTAPIWGWWAVRCCTTTTSSIKGHRKCGPQNYILLHAQQIKTALSVLPYWISTKQLFQQKCLLLKKWTGEFLRFHKQTKKSVYQQRI